MANFFLFAISAIICAGAWFISRGRFGRFGIYLGRFFIAGALVGVSSAFTGDEFVINTFIGNALLGFVFINIGTIIYYRFSTILEGVFSFFRACYELYRMMVRVVGRVQGCLVGPTPAM